MTKSEGLRMTGDGEAPLRVSDRVDLVTIFGKPQRDYGSDVALKEGCVLA